MNEGHTFVTMQRLATNLDFFGFLIPRVRGNYDLSSNPSLLSYSKKMNTQDVLRDELS